MLEHQRTLNNSNDPGDASQKINDAHSALSFSMIPKFPCEGQYLITESVYSKK
jgi:hypothetical protein